VSGVRGQGLVTHVVFAEALHEDVEGVVQVFVHLLKLLPFVSQALVHALSKQGMGGRGAEE
jgi:hypothetical protein